MFGKHWTGARGTIVDRKASWTGDGMVADYDFVVDVTTPSGEVFRAKVPTPRIATDFRDPSIGETVAVEYDAESKKVRFDKEDPQLSMKAFRRSRETSFDASLNAPAGTAAGGSRPAANPSAPSMEELKAMLGDAAGAAQVVRLGPDDPTSAALREALLNAIGTPPEAPKPEQ